VINHLEGDEAGQQAAALSAARPCGGCVERQAGAVVELVKALRRKQQAAVLSALGAVRSLRVQGPGQSDD